MNPEDAAQLHPNDVVITSEHRVKASPPNTANLLAQHQLPMLSQPENEDLKEKKAKAIAISSTVAPVQASDQKPSNLLVYNIATLLELGKGPSVTPRIMELCDSDIKGKISSIPDSSGACPLFDVPFPSSPHIKQRRDIHTVLQQYLHLVVPELVYPFLARARLSYIDSYLQFPFLMLSFKDPTLTLALQRTC